MEQELTTTTAAEPATLEQLTLEVKFYLGQTAQNIIEVGKRLTQAKELVPHGDFGSWLEKNFSLSQPTASRFMRCAERFANYSTLNNFNSSQLITMLELPADETKAFIEAKAAAGTPVEDMTVKKLREEVQQWKDKAEKATEDNERGKTYNVAIRKDRDRLKTALYEAEQKLQKQPQVIIQPPDDYEQVKQDLAKLRNEKAALQKKLDATVRNVEVPADYHANKKKLAELDSKIAEMQKQLDTQVTAEDYGNVAHKLDTILSLINDVLNSKNAGRVIADYERNRPDRYNMILAQFETFLEVMK